MNRYRKAAKMIAKASDILYGVCKDDLNAGKTDILAMEDFEKVLAYATELATLARNFDNFGFKKQLDEDDTDETENI